MKFSQRMGFTPIKNVLQTNSMDEDLRNGLWNAFLIFYWDSLVKSYWTRENKPNVLNFIKVLWIHFFKNPLDEMPNKANELMDYIKDFFYDSEWHGVYDFIEFLPSNYSANYGENTNTNFINYCNIILEKEKSGYRFLDNKLTAITSSIELDSIEDALKNADSFLPVTTHFKRALELFSDRKAPDYRNSIKESISAVEAHCKILTGHPKATLGQALKKIEDRTELHPALKSAFSSLYGYSNDTSGIRHALLDEDELRQEDAKFMLVACSAFINYLKQKSAN